MYPKKGLISVKTILYLRMSLTIFKRFLYEEELSLCYYSWCSVFRLRYHAYESCQQG